MSDHERLLAIRAHVERAHREVQVAQRLAYASDDETGGAAPLRVRLALDRQIILIRLLVHRLPFPARTEEGASQ